MSNLSPFLAGGGHSTFTTTSNNIINSSTLIRNPSWSYKISPPLQQQQQHQIRMDVRNENEEHISRHLEKVHNENGGKLLSSDESHDNDQQQDQKSACEEKLIKMMTKNSIQESQSSLLTATNDELKVFNVDEEEQQQHQPTPTLPLSSNVSTSVCFNGATAGLIASIPSRPPFLPIRTNTTVVPLFTTATLGGYNTSSSSVRPSNLVFSSSNNDTTANTNNNSMSLKMHSTVPTPAFSRSSSLNSLNSCLLDDDVKSIQSSVASEYSLCIGPSSKYKKSTTTNMERVNESDNDDDDDDYQDKSRFDLDQSLTGGGGGGNNQGDLSLMTIEMKPPSALASCSSSFLDSQRALHKEQQAYFREKAMIEKVGLMESMESSSSKANNPNLAPVVTISQLPPPSQLQPQPLHQYKFQQQQSSMNLTHSPATRDTFNPPDLPKPFALNTTYAFLNSSTRAPLPGFMLAHQHPPPTAVAHQTNTTTTSIHPSFTTQQFKFNTPPTQSFQFNNNNNNNSNNNKAQPSIMDTMSYYDSDVLRVYPPPRPKQITNLISANASPPESVCSHMSDVSLPSVINQDIERAKSGNLQELYQQLNLTTSRSQQVSHNPICQNLASTFNQMVDTSQVRPVSLPQPQTQSQPQPQPQTNQNVIDSMPSSSTSSKTASQSSTPSTTANYSRSQQANNIDDTSDEEDNDEHEQETDDFINKFFVPNSPASPSMLNSTIAGSVVVVEPTTATLKTVTNQDAQTSKRNLKRTSLQNFDIRYAPSQSKQQFGAPKRQPSFSNSRSSISSSISGKVSNKLPELPPSEASSSLKATKTSSKATTSTKSVQSKLSTAPALQQSQASSSQSNPPVINMTKAAQLRAAAVTSKQQTTAASTIKSTSSFKSSGGGVCSPVKSFNKSIIAGNSMSQRRKSLIIGTSGNTTTTAITTSQPASSSQRLMMKPPSSSSVLTVKQQTTNNNKPSTNNQIKLNK